MESKRDGSESVFLKPTSGLLWDIMDEDLYPRPLAQACRLFSFHPPHALPCTPPCTQPLLRPSVLHSTGISRLYVIIINLNLMEIW